MPKHIGIAACSAEGAALCYSTICIEGAERLGKYAHPEVSLHSPPFDEYMRHIETGDWAEVARMMLESEARLRESGADFVICPDNTIHQAFDIVAEKASLPWLHIAEEVAKEAQKQGFRRLGIMGTRYLMEGPVYPDKLSARGIAHQIPTKDEREMINRVIFDELVEGRFLECSRSDFIDLISKLKREGCDAVVLGCTEIPLLISPEDSPLPVLDSTRLLARAALREAIGPSAP